MQPLYEELHYLFLDLCLEDKAIYVSCCLPVSFLQALLKKIVCVCVCIAITLTLFQRKTFLFFPMDL